jgi:hypothetical protein
MATKRSTPTGAELNEIQLEVLGRKASRFMGVSSKVNSFLLGEFTIPSAISEPVKWAEKQALGVLSSDQILAHLTAMKAEKVDEQVRAKAEWLGNFAEAMTPAQKARVEPTLAQYRDFLSAYVAKAKVCAAVVKKVAEITSPAKATAKETAKAEA